MKAGKEHRVPLSDAALAILNALPHADRNALVFASPRGGMLSDISLTAVLRRMKVDAVLGQPCPVPARARAGVDFVALAADVSVESARPVA